MKLYFLRCVCCFDYELCGFYFERDGLWIGYLIKIYIKKVFGIMDFGNFILRFERNVNKEKWFIVWSLMCVYRLFLGEDKLLFKEVGVR